MAPEAAGEGESRPRATPVRVDRTAGENAQPGFDEIGEILFVDVTHST
jgi:hypothetical protein